MRDFDKVAAPHAAISTRAEWLRLQQQRATPELKLRLTPDNALSADIEAQSAARDEDRLAFLIRQLDRAREQLEQDHSLSRLEGHARAEFGRGR